MTQNPPSKPDSDALAYLYSRPGFMIRRAHQICLSMFVETCSGLNITPTQYGILTVLRHSDAIDQISVARLLGLDRSTTALVVGLLEERGLLVKTPGRVDKRKNELKLTEEGAVLWADGDRVLGQLKDTLLEPFSAREKKEFLQLLKKFNTTFNSRARTELLGDK